MYMSDYAFNSILSISLINWDSGVKTKYFIYMLHVEYVGNTVYFHDYIYCLLIGMPSNNYIFIVHLTIPLYSWTTVARAKNLSQVFSTVTNAIFEGHNSCGAAERQALPATANDHHVDKIVYESGWLGNIIRKMGIAFRPVLDIL